MYGENKKEHLMPAEKSKIQAIFNEAIALDSHEDRVRYLDQTCVDDDQIRARVEALLNAHSEAGVSLVGNLPMAPPRKSETLPKPLARSSVPTNSLSRLAKGAWAPFSWPSKPCQCSA